MQQIEKMKLLILFFFFLLPIVLADLRVGYYKNTCPQAESIVQSVVQKRYRTDRAITGALLRMHFHDCFVRGCDASILIDPTTKKPSEKSAGPNLTIRGFELIDEAKAAVEAQCPYIVSCADIITLATRDSIRLAGGPSFAVPTGRRDGLVSNPQEVSLPGSSFTVSQALQAFTNKGLTLSDMVTLLGAHTVGVTHCIFFRDRLSNFQGSGAADPSMDPNLVKKLLKICGTQSKPLNQEPTVFLDQNTSFIFDNEIYHQIKLKRGILRIDQELGLDSSTSPLVSRFGSNGMEFSRKFADAMVKMASIGVLLDNAGEIRRNCRKFN